MGLLTRNIKVIGQDYSQLFEESFGARVLVGAYSWEGIDYKGTHRTPGIRQTLLNIVITVSFVLFSIYGVFIRIAACMYNIDLRCTLLNVARFVFRFKRLNYI